MQHISLASLDRTPSWSDTLAILDRSLPDRQVVGSPVHPTFPVHRTHPRRKVAHK